MIFNIVRGCSWAWLICVDERGLVPKPVARMIFTNASTCFLMFHIMVTIVLDMFMIFHECSWMVLRCSCIFPNAHGFYWNWSGVLDCSCCSWFSWFLLLCLDLCWFFLFFLIAINYYWLLLISPGFPGAFLFVSIIFLLIHDLSFSGFSHFSQLLLCFLMLLLFLFVLSLLLFCIPLMFLFSLCFNCSWFVLLVCFSLFLLVFNYFAW